MITETYFNLHVHRFLALFFVFLGSSFSVTLGLLAGLISDLYLLEFRVNRPRHGPC